jgi:type II secretory pathway predicted ATPase ExeA/phage tail protein X
MYESFYNLAEKPFDLTHSSRFLYLGEVHREALSMLTYGVMERKGFALLTGEVGTGKTTILQAMLNDLDKTVKYVHLANPLLSPNEFINYLTLSAFRNRISFKSKAEFLLAFEAFLTRCSQHQKHFLLVIDEAHKLSYDLLEEIRLLSNMETADEKLISIFLVGQPELNQKLNDPRCRALLQRISIRYNIKPLNLQETEEYITKRLEVAGARKADDLFPGGVRKAIHEYSGGFPRMINILSDNLLLLGYAKGQRKLSPAMVRECYEDLKLDDAVPARTSEPETKIVEKKPEPRPSPPARSGFWKWALIALLAILLAAAAFQYGEEIRTRVMNLVSVYSKRERPAPVREQYQAGVQDPTKASTLSSKEEEESPEIVNTVTPSAGEAQKKTDDSAPPRVRKADNPINPSPLMGEVYPPVAAPIRKTPNSFGEATRGGGGKDVEYEGGVELVLGQPRRGEFSETIIVQDGDTLDKLAKRVYGRSDEKIWEMIQKSNPDIRDVDFIRPGQRLIFPPLPEMHE